MRTIAEYFYKILVTGVYFLCSMFAPLQPVEMYMNPDWLLPKIAQEVKGIEAFFGFFMNMHEAAGLASVFTGMDIMKEIFYGLLVAVFFKVGNTLYGSFSVLAKKIFGGGNLLIKITDGICTLMIMLIAIIGSAIVMDTVFYHLPESSYPVLVIITGAILLGLCFVAYYCKAMLGVKQSEKIIGVILDMVLDIFGVILIYFTVACYMELTTVTHGLGSYLLLVGLLIACIGGCTALFVYLMYGLKDFLH